MPSKTRRPHRSSRGVGVLISMAAAVLFVANYTLAFLLPSSSSTTQSAYQTDLSRSGTMLRSGVPVGASPSRMDVDYRPIGVLVLGVTLASLLAASVHRRKSGKTPKRSGLARRAVAGASAIGRFDPGPIMAVADLPYCKGVDHPIRRKTRTVMVGNVPVGSEHRLALQTMSNSSTDDVDATVKQIERCADAGIDIVRVTVQGIKEAHATKLIKERLLKDGYTTPIVADIHFKPKVAMLAAEACDKIRINPGNFIDGMKTFDKITEVTPEIAAEWQEEMFKTLKPLVESLKRQGKCMRIGVNHGSLSERILTQYGDTPEGMVASALEVGLMCRALDFHNIIFSMKSSNTRVMVAAYRLLAAEMEKRGWDYPLHLGVTEAGGGSDGRIKSAIGIGALLQDGLGDTVRVSLTEDPWHEVGPCSALRDVYEESLKARPKHTSSNRSSAGAAVADVDPYHFAKREIDTSAIDAPLHKDGSLILRYSPEEAKKNLKEYMTKGLGLKLRKDGRYQKDIGSVDVLLVENETDADMDVLKAVQETGVVILGTKNILPGSTLLVSEPSMLDSVNPARAGGCACIVRSSEDVDKVLGHPKKGAVRFLIFKPDSAACRVHAGRQVAKAVRKSRLPLLMWFTYPEGDSKAKAGSDAAVILGASEFGSLFVDGLGDGIFWDDRGLTTEETRDVGLNLMQGSRMRLSKTEFISCPSCGRTLFDLQDTTERIRKKTGHLSGLRIAVMGCVVNGPGEMADADFGYVGSLPGKVDLYVGKQCVRRAVDYDKAEDVLVDLIKSEGLWVDPPEPTTSN
uniref:4-hydroxy-3-methylbut-2-en-1-yl diphosphate synthase (ferredoxin), chloroplastic n=1 Tax=Perkinsus marinus TaxID=31276 RepID=B1Q2Q6_9ALVE|nr:4-hydroxy-3-methylbut-2-en-1-yl diphosphate synthase [Perkinsus marinus ATCC 50439]